MITHIIYHISGRKVGCTNNLEIRKKMYFDAEGKIPNLEILEELQDKTDQEAGDIEWQWADRFGYKRGNHYTIIVAAARERARRGLGALSTDQLSEAGKSGARRLHELGLGGFGNLTSDQRIEYGKRGGYGRARNLTPERLIEISRKAYSSGHGKLSPEQRSANARKASLRALELNVGGFRLLTPEAHSNLGRVMGKTKGICPHCGIEANLGNLHKWHLDRCAKKPVGFVRRS
jgi:hypothetical protein